MMTERQGDEVEARSGQGNGQAEIRFLKEKKRSGLNVYLVAVLLLAVGLLYALVYRRAIEPQGTPLPADQAASLLVDRLWVDELPQREHDQFNFYIFSSEDNFGVNDKAQSVYKHLIEIFFYRLSGDSVMHFQFPHDRRSAKSSYKLEKLQRPRGDLDLMLTVDKDPQMGNKSQVYYSSTKWSSHDRATLPANLRQLPALDMRSPAAQR